MSKPKPCAWKCGRLTERRCRICLECCNARDELDKRIDAGLAKYIPPDQRPGHRFYKGDGPKRVMTDKQKAALRAARVAKSLNRIRFKGHFEAEKA